MHKKDEDKYVWHLFDLTKAFPNFIYRSLDSLEPSSPMNEAKETKCSETT